MIHTEKGFYAALERATQYLEHPPAAGSAEEREFTKLLEDLEAYRPSAASRPEPPPRTREQTEADSLNARAAALLKSVDERKRRQRLDDFPQDGRGIGPTTGAR